MAIFKEMRRVRPSSSKAFDRVLRSGAEAPFDGIYRCTGCDIEKAVPGGRLLPSQAQFPHPNWCQGITWQLLVATTGAAKPQASEPPAEGPPENDG